MGCACGPLSPAQLPAAAAAAAAPPTSTRFLTLRPRFLASAAPDRRQRRSSLLPPCSSIRGPNFPFPSLFLRNTSPSASHFPHLPLPPPDYGGAGNHNNSSNNNNGGSSGGAGWGNSFDSDGTGSLLFVCSRAFANDDLTIHSSLKRFFFFLFASTCSFGLFQLASAQAITSNSADDNEKEELEVVWEVRGGKWIKLIADHFRDAFVVSSGKSSSSSDGGNGADGQLPFGIVSDLWMQCRDLVLGLMLPEGFPHSVTSDYLEYSLWRGVQGVAAQISGVLATQVLVSL